MKSSEILRRAAARLDKLPGGWSTGACRQIRAAAGGGAATVKAMEYPSNYFQNDACDGGSFSAHWGANFGAPETRIGPLREISDYDYEKAKKCRVLMLLFCAELAEQDGD